MELKDKNIPLNKIFLDKNNPRFLYHDCATQEELKQRILRMKEAKDVIKSMKEAIRWVNRIVVRIHPTEVDKYLVVEGNIRIACLKSGQIPKYEDQDNEVPVLLAVQETDETDDSFEEQIRILQGIANVMVVKQWGAVAKARHLSKLFWDKRDNGMSKSQAVKSVSDSLGTTNAEIRNAVRRYGFFKEIARISTSLEENEYSHLEAIDRNKEIKEFFGFNGTTFKFEWDGLEEDSINEDMENKQERLSKIPEFIKGISVVDLKRHIPKVIENSTDDDKFNEIIEGTLTWEQVKVGETEAEPETEEDPQEIWTERLTDIKTAVQAFPVLTEWSDTSEILDLLNQISSAISRLIDLLSDSQEEN